MRFRRISMLDAECPCVWLCETLSWINTCISYHRNCPLSPIYIPSVGRRMRLSILCFGFCSSPSVCLFPSYWERFCTGICRFCRNHLCGSCCMLKPWCQVSPPARHCMFLPLLTEVLWGQVSPPACHCCCPPHLPEVSPFPECPGSPRAWLLSGQPVQ